MLVYKSGPQRMIGVKELNVEALRAGVIGLGIGKRHAMVLAEMEEAELVAIADFKEELAHELGEQLDCTFYEEGSELLANEELDFVCICTPPAVHLPLTEEAAKQGVNVFCEKPMAGRLEDCDGMIGACEEAGVQLMVGQKKRFQPAFTFVKQMINEDFGVLRWATLRYACGRVPMDWFWEEGNGGGPLVENSVHAVDTLRYLMGEVERVYAEGGNLFNEDRAPQLDTAAVSLRFEGGGIAAIGCGQAYEWGFARENSYFAHENALVEISGSFDNPEHLRYILRSEPDTMIEVDRPEKNLFNLELRHFCECIRSGETPLVSGEEARKSVAVCLAIKESSRTGKPIPLSE